jgi:hypothetical protein
VVVRLGCGDSGVVWVSAHIVGGSHATLYPDEALSLGGADAVVKDDGDVIWPLALRDRRLPRFAVSRQRFSV